MFAGILSIEQPLSAWGEPARIADALAPYSNDKPRDFWRTERQMLLQVATRTGSTLAEIYCHAESGVAVAFWGRLDNRPDLIAQLDAEHKASDDELIALAWLKWGEHCPEKLIGDFAFAVASPKTGTVFLARDVMGVKPLFYRADAHGVFFANSAAAFKPLKLGTLTASQEWMARYLAVLSMSHTETAYEEIKKLPGAHSLLIHADGRMNLRRYHQFVDDAPKEKTRDPKYLEAYRAVWQQAVACRIPDSGNIGTENSGGLDSGSITAEIARQLGADIDRLHGMGFATEPLEPVQIMANAMKYGMANNFICSSYAGRYSDSLATDSLHRECLVNGYPLEHPTAATNLPFYAYCRQQGIGTLYSGFGGDEVVTNEAFPLRAELYDQGEWRNLWRILPGAWPMRFGRLAKTVLQRMVPPDIGKQLESDWIQYSMPLFLNHQAISCHGVKSAYFSAAKYDLHFQRVNDFALSQIGQTFVPTRLENCTLLASSFGVDYVWPLWDQRLVQQWLSTPGIWKIGPDGISRYLHRRAVDGVCADAVVWTGKDMGGDAVNNAEDADSVNRFIELTEQAPPELACLMDIQKARSLRERGVYEERINGDFSHVFLFHMATLESASMWLNREFR